MTAKIAVIISSVLMFYFCVHMNIKEHAKVQEMPKNFIFLKDMNDYNNMKGIR